MFITRVYIDGFGCLKDFSINFSEAKDANNTENLPDIHITPSNNKFILIGKNGTGKSTFLEAILKIFASFDAPSQADGISDYEIEYIYLSQLIKIKCNLGIYSLEVNNKKYINECSLQTFRVNLNFYRGSILPYRIITFYSGDKRNIEIISNKASRTYSQQCKQAILGFLDFIFATENPQYQDAIQFPARRFVHCNQQAINMYLLSILGDSNLKAELEEHLEIYNNTKTITTISFNLNTIYKSVALQIDKIKDQRITKEILFQCFEFIDIRIGQFIRENYIKLKLILPFDKLYDFDTSNDEDKDFYDYGHEFDKISVSIMLNNFHTYSNNARQKYDFLEKLVTLFNAKIDILFKAGRNHPHDMTSNGLSEGQRQLVKLLGVSVVSKNEDCLVLIDEIDAHMNPQWKYNLKEMMDKYFEASIATQIIMATHEPLVINGVPKEQIKIFERVVEEEEQKIIVHDPSESTEGMGIDAILQSEYYGLKNSYDKATADKYQRRQELYLKLIQEDISDNEKLELGNLSEQLGSLPFANNTIDFIYDDFMQEFRNTEYYDKEYLSFDELQNRREEIKRILAKIHEGK